MIEPNVRVEAFPGNFPVQRTLALAYVVTYKLRNKVQVHGGRCGSGSNLSHQNVPDLMNLRAT